MTEARRAACLRAALSGTTTPWAALRKWAPSSPVRQPEPQAGEQAEDRSLRSSRLQDGPVNTSRVCHW